MKHNIKDTILKKYDIDEDKYTETIAKIHPRIYLGENLLTSDSVKSLKKNNKYKKEYSINYFFVSETINDFVIPKSIITNRFITGSRCVQEINTLIDNINVESLGKKNILIISNKFHITEALIYLIIKYYGYDYEKKNHNSNYI